MPARHRLIAAAAVASVAALTVVAPSLGSAPPIGPLPSGPASTIETRAGELVAVALPHRANGRVWRIAGAVAPTVLRQVSEADVGDQVVLVFKTVRPGKAVVSFGLTRGERPKAFESRRFTFVVTA